MTVVRKHPDPVIRRALGERPLEVLAELGVMPLAVDATGFHPETREHGLATICRLVPVTDLAKVRFAAAKIEAAEAVVWWDPGDDLEVNLLQGFHSATIVARQVLDAPGSDRPARLLS